jgi:hypothetical protein
MGTALWLVAVGLACVLLMFSTYAVMVGVAGVLSGTRYLQCPRCHHHYMGGHAGLGHRCPHGVAERVYQLAWARLHHLAAHTQHPTGAIAHEARSLWLLAPPSANEHALRRTHQIGGDTGPPARRQQ